MLLIKWLSHVPLSLLYIKSNFLYLLIYYLVGYRKKVVLENLKLAFPEKRDAEIKKIRKAFYRHFCDLIFEILAIRTMSQRELERRVSVVNPELMKSYFDANQSIILVVGHQCNWEWLLQRACVTYNMPFDAVYKKLQNEKFDEFMIDIRSRFGGTPIEMQQTGREIIRRRKEVRGFCMVADQSPSSTELDYFTDFFGKQTPFYSGMATIAQMTKYPVIFADMRKIKRGHYEVEMKVLGEAPYEKGDKTLVDDFAKTLENQISKQPAYWLWSHRRWKHALE
jgi:Kdo2-lipid IVA lauroyltransferase/acyltransferase